MLIYDTAITEELPKNPVFHTEPLRLGQVATAANVKTLVLSHVIPVTVPLIKVVKSRVRESYVGNLKVAKDLKVYNFGDDD